MILTRILLILLDRLLYLAWRLLPFALSYSILVAIFGWP